MSKKTHVKMTSMEQNVEYFCIKKSNGNEFRFTFYKDDSVIIHLSTSTIKKINIICTKMNCAISDNGDEYLSLEITKK